MANYKNVFYNVLEQHGHSNIITNSILVFFQSSHYTYFHVYILFHYSSSINILAASLSRLTSLQLQIWWEEKLFFSKNSKKKKQSVLISVGQNQLPCLFLNTIPRCQGDMIRWLAKPEIHTHHLGAQQWCQPHLRHSGTQNGEDCFPRKIDYRYNKKGKWLLGC